MRSIVPSPSLLFTPHAIHSLLDLAPVGWLVARARRLAARPVLEQAVLAPLTRVEAPSLGHLLLFGDRGGARAGGAAPPRGPAGGVGGGGGGGGGGAAVSGQTGSHNQARAIHENRLRLASTYFLETQTANRFITLDPHDVCGGGLKRTASTF